MRLSLPCRTSSSQTAGGNWLGGVMATMPEGRPLVRFRPLSFDSSSRRVSFSRFLNAFQACFNSFGGGELGGVSVMQHLPLRWKHRPHLSQYGWPAVWQAHRLNGKMSPRREVPAVSMERRSKAMRYRKFGRLGWQVSE